MKAKGALGPGLVFFFTAMGPGTFLVERGCRRDIRRLVDMGFGPGAGVPLRVGEHSRFVRAGDS